MLFLAHFGPNSDWTAENISSNQMASESKECECFPCPIWKVCGQNG